MAGVHAAEDGDGLFLNVLTSPMHLTFDNVDGRQRRKRSRWGDDTAATSNLVGIQTTIPPNLTPLQQQCFLCLEELAS